MNPCQTRRGCDFSLQQWCIPALGAAPEVGILRASVGSARLTVPVLLLTLDGKRKLKMQTFSGKLYTTEAEVRRAVGAIGPGLHDGTLCSPSVVVIFTAFPRTAYILLEHRMGVEPMNTGFADQRVSHFATGAHTRDTTKATSRAFGKRLLPPVQNFTKSTAVATSCADTALPSYILGRSSPRPRWRPRQ